MCIATVANTVGGLRIWIISAAKKLRSKKDSGTGSTIEKNQEILLQVVFTL
jgi:hypothetical protein